MRKFNAFEKKILTTLYHKSKEAESESQILILLNFFTEFVLHNRALSINNEKETMTFVYRKDEDQYAPKELLNFFTLIDYLKSTGLIISFQNNWFSEEPEKFLSHNLTNDGKDYVFPIRQKIQSNHKIPDYSITYPKGYYQKLRNLLQQQIMLSPALEHLIQEKFQTSEDKALKQSRVQTILSFIALGLSFLTLGLSWVLLEKSDNKEVILNQNQFDAISKKLSGVEVELDSINKTLNQSNDSISEIQLTPSQFQTLVVPLNAISRQLEKIQKQQSN